MPVLLAALVPILEGLAAWMMRAMVISALLNAAAIVVKILVVLGLHFYVVAPFTDQLMQLASDQFGALPQAAADWLGYLNFDKYVSLILSAYSVRATTNFVMGLTSPSTATP